MYSFLPSSFPPPPPPAHPSSRQSIEALWYSLADTNPELMGDFEEFVGEIANEVEVAQRALK